MRSVTSFLFCLLSFFFSSVPAHSATFNIASGDVEALIAAINAANGNGEENTINLAPGLYTLTSVYDPLRLSGLPAIMSLMTINGESPQTTVIERNAIPQFRIVRIGEIGNVTINRITLRGGSVGGAGGGILNSGLLTIYGSIIEDNNAFGGGIYNSGTLVVRQTHVRRNHGHDGAGILNFGHTTIVESSIVENVGDSGVGFLNLESGTAIIRNSAISGNGANGFFPGVRNLGVMTITGSTIANNSVGVEPIGIAIANQSLTSDSLTITDSTISGNHSFSYQSGFAVSGQLTMQNTIVAGNPNLRECPTISLGNNLFGDPTGCSSPLHPTDLTGDPGLSAFIDDGAPGHGRFPLLPGSPAIDAANDIACSSTDQLGTPRRGRCDIGAVEFYPVINDLMTVGNVSTDFDPTPLPGGLAGTFRIKADFANTSDQVIVNPFVEVVDLSGGNLLLNADGGAGGVGARIKFPDADSSFTPGARQTLEFDVGMQTRDQFNFLVNVLGDNRASE